MYDDFQKVKTNQLPLLYLTKSIIITYYVIKEHNLISTFPPNINIMIIKEKALELLYFLERKLFTSA